MGKLHPVLLCGGAGARLWPLSRPERPKALLPLVGPASLLQQTAVRLAALKEAAPALVIASQRHAGEVRGQLADVGIAARLMFEPTPRGTAPAIAAAALEIVAGDPGAIILVAACDHFLSDAAAFASAVAAAAPAAAAGAIVTFGIRPTAPTSAYGYVRPGEALAGPVRQARGFIEKPDAARAAELIAAGWLWNSGAFVFSAATILGELQARQPAILEAAKSALAAGRRTPDSLVLGEAFADAPAVSIDVAVMEKTDRAAVLPVAYAWSDLGAWDAVLAASERDAGGNALFGNAVATGCQNVLAHAGPGMRIVAVGLSNIAIVIEDGRVLVCDLGHAQQVRAIGEAER
jgi:mannose-1-phosphate guanylyltransferase/mannose-6-phosphate isomerase